MEKERRRMTLLHRVSIRIRREKKKAMTLLTSFFAICLLIFVGTAFTEGVNASLKELREQFHATLSIEQTISGNSIVSPELAEAAVVAAKPEGWTGNNICYLSMNDISLVPGMFTPQGDEAASIAKLISCRDTSLAREFSMERYRLTEGRHLTEDDEKKVIISEDLAMMNGLSIGDTIGGVVTDDIAIAAKQGIGTIYEYEIIGIFVIENALGSSVSNQRAECEMDENCMFVDEQSGFEIVENIRQKERQYVNGVIMGASDPTELSDMYDSVTSLSGYDWEKYYVSTNAAEYEKSAEPMTRMEKIVSIFMLIVTVIALLIFAVILTMWNHERIHEMAILLSVGCSKATILAQLFLENLFLFLAGYVAAIPVLQLLMVFFKNFTTFQGGEITGTGLALIGVAGTGLVALVTAISSVKILRKSPKELLTIQS